MCDVLNVSRSSFYHYFYYSKTNYNNFFTLLNRISNIFYSSHEIYGSPRITAVLHEEGFKISSKTVLKYMRFLELIPISCRNFPYKKNKMPDHEKSLIVNRIKHLDIFRPDQVWTTDITYIYTKEDGWVYLSSIMDLYSRKIIAWNIGHNMKKELVIENLNNAFKNRGFPINVIIHSDKGSQYRSKAFRKIISEHLSLPSYTSFHHSCDENASQESFHATIKKEWLESRSFNTIHDVKRAVFEYIEGFYNSVRIHSSLGYLSPISFESNYFTNIPLLELSNILT